jgi:hypothetical protein
VITREDLKDIAARYRTGPQEDVVRRLRPGPVTRLIYAARERFRREPARPDPVASDAAVGWGVIVHFRDGTRLDGTIESTSADPELFFVRDKIGDLHVVSPLACGAIVRDWPDPPLTVSFRSRLRG